MPRSFDICILGTGIVGRTLALHLAGLQLRVALVDPLGAHASAPPADRDIRAFALNHRSRELLGAVRAWPEGAGVTAVRSMEVHGDDGGSVHFSAAEQGTEALNWIVDVPTLEDLLAGAVRFQPRIETMVCSTTEDLPEAALTVVCEGKASRTREWLGVDFDTTPYNQHALATRITAIQAHNQTAHQWFAAGEILALLPIEGAGGSQFAVVWSLPPEKAALLRDCPEAEFAAALEAASHGAVGVDELAGGRNTWPLQHAMAARWCGTSPRGSWVLAGDAAHTVHPLAGQGLNLGLGDVAALVQTMATKPYWRTTGDMRLLRPYERARKTACTLVGGTGDALQQLFSMTNPSVQTLRNWGMQGFERGPNLKSWVAQHAMGGSFPSEHVRPNVAAD